MDVEELLAAVYEVDFEAIESGRDYVDDDTLEELLPEYGNLETWPQRVAFANLVQDSDDPRLRPIMLEILRAPNDDEDLLDLIELTKAVALGFVDERYDRFQHYYDDRQALHAAVAEVLGADAPSAPARSAEPRAPLADEPRLLGACVAGRRDIALEEIARGADVHMTRVGGQSPLWWAANHGWLDVVHVLLAKGPPVDGPDQYGGTPLMRAVQSSAEVTRALLAAGANPRAAYQDGRTVVWFAAHHGHVDVVRALLDAGVGIDDVHAGATLLALAVYENHAALVDELVARGANVDLPAEVMHVRRTPLMIAAQRGYPSLVQTLLAAGANRDIAIDGVRAIDLATDRRADDVRALLHGR